MISKAGNCSYVDQGLATFYKRVDRNLARSLLEIDTKHMVLRLEIKSITSYAIKHLAQNDERHHNKIPSIVTI